MCAMTFRENFETQNYPCDFCFSETQLTLKRRRFDDIIMIQEQLQNALAELKKQNFSVQFQLFTIPGPTSRSHKGATLKMIAWNVG
jgi:hypothetical protein